MKRSQANKHERPHSGDYIALLPFVSWLLAAMLLLPLAGCSWISKHRSGTWWMPKSCRFDSDIAKVELVAALNRDVVEIKSWQTTNATLKLEGPGAPLFGIPAFIAVENPRRFKLTGNNPLGGAELDIGSNEERFWVWVKQMPEKHVFFANHADFAGPGARGRLPVQPDWLMSAFIMQPLDPHALEMTAIDDHLVKLTPAVGTDHGPLQRTLIVDLCEGHIVEQQLVDRGGQMMARLRFEDFRRCDNAPVVMAHRLYIESPPTEMTIEMKLGRVQVNPSQIDSSLWEMPTIAGSPPMNMADMLPPRTGPTQFAEGPFPDDIQEQRSTNKLPRPQTFPVYNVQPATHEEAPQWDPSETSPF